MEIPPISCATYDNINHFLYLGTCYSAGQDDIFIYNYDINVDEHNYINKLATNNIPSKSENKPYYLFCANEKAYASKESEIVRIDYKGDYKFESSQVIEKVNNYFYTCALDEQLDNVLALNLEGVIHVIDNTGQYFDNPDIQVGIKVNDAYHIPFKDIVCFYTRDLFQDNHLVVYDNHSKVIIADIKNEHPISDVIYNPFTSEILVSYYSGEVNYLSRYSYTPPATINEEKVYFQNSNDNYCGKIFIDPNHHLYCAVGLDNINDAKILFINADNYSQINSFALNGVTNLTDFKVSFTYHKPNSFVYSTIMQFSDDFNYSDIVEINPSGIGSLIHLISQHDLPVKIESCPVHNKLYVQYMNDNHITRIKWIDNTIDYFDDFNLPNVCILDIAYDDHLDFLYFTNGFSQTGFIYCDLDIFNEERVFDNGHSYYPIIFNKKNNFLYSYCPNDHPARINKLMSSEPLFWSESNVITLNNTINRKSEIGYMNTLSVDDYKNFLFIPNGSQCNFTVVRCTPERRYLGQGIPNPYEPFNYNYISFPSLERLEGVEDNPVSAIDVLSKFEPFTESPVITMEGRVPGNSEPYTIYHPHDGEWSGTLTDVFSSRGYALQHNVPSGQVCYIPMEGMRLDPGYDQIKLYYGANIENWTGYFIDETQNIFNALGEVEQDLNLIIAQCWACTRQFWSGDPGINQSWMCRTAIGAENIPVGGISYGTMVRLTLKPNVPFRTFGWSSGQEPYPIITKSDPVHFIFNSNSLYTPIFIELDTSARPLEIGAFIGNTCIGATTVNLDDTIIMVPAYNNGDTTSIIEFEEYFGDLKSPNRNRIINYRSFNSKINKITDNTIRICSPENGAYFVSLKKEDIIEEQNIQTSFMCYPNPYQAGSLTLTANLDSASDIQIEIFDARSRLCAFYEIGDQPSGLFNCNLENLEISAQLSPGIYLVKMKTGVRELYTKLIIR
ncbi:MAG: T9SS type A sorting domain-containing protein [Ignavibacteriaceae bacterium]|jgi:hypothetical protein|nr:T9SS type A sorting domain-containing protein [Ignavibacteriaceae bacterium]